jgi:hypothetical protein
MAAFDFAGVGLPYGQYPGRMDAQRGRVSTRGAVKQVSFDARTYLAKTKVGKPYTFFFTHKANQASQTHLVTQAIISLLSLRKNEALKDGIDADE